MNSDPQARKVWESVLPEIRRKRQQRNAIKLSAVSICIIAIAWTLFVKHLPRTTETTAAIIAPNAPVTTNETLAVMRVGDDGVVRLEEIGTDQLGSVELAFGLTPLICNPDSDEGSDLAGLEFYR